LSVRENDAGSMPSASSQAATESRTGVAQHAAVVEHHRVDLGGGVVGYQEIRRVAQPRVELSKNCRSLRLAFKDLAVDIILNNTGLPDPSQVLRR
jgi:hypothetical protein